MRMRNDKKRFDDSGIAVPLRPNDPDVKYAGEEPRFDTVTEDGRSILLARAFVWYNTFYGKKDAREMLALYLEHIEQHDQAKRLRKVPEYEVIVTYGWLSRMVLRGLKLTDSEKEMLNTEVQRLLHRQPINHAMEDGEAPTRPNVQEILRDRAREVGGELEGYFDQFILDGAKTVGSTRVIDELTRKNVLPQHVGILAESWKRKQSQFEEVVTGSDRDLVQAYSNFTKTQLKNCVKYCEQVLSDLNSYVNLKKASKAPRIRKPVPVEKIVRGLKYLKTFKDGKLELNSLPPTKLHGCSEAYVYDTELRKLIYLVADEYVKTLSVKGTTVLGFDTIKSQVKTIRKPLETLTEFMKLGKPAGRKYFDEIKTVGVTPKGRINERMIILKAW